MAHKLHASDLARPLAAEALHQGAFDRFGQTIRWDLAAKCERPVNQTAHIRDEPKTAGGFRTGGRSGYSSSSEQWNVDYNLRCRHCEPCLRARRAMWALRARSEVLASLRTWFGTITLAPENHFRMLTQARQRLHRGGTVFEALSEREQFAERHRETSAEITKWLKRVRHHAKVPLRVLLVVERHKSGLPHYHCLVHETIGAVTYRQLSSTWPHGFVNFKLVDTHDTKCAYYVTKYLAKSAEARVRASLGYGNPTFNPLALGGAFRKELDCVVHSELPEREENDLPKRTREASASEGASAPVNWDLIS